VAELNAKEEEEGKKVEECERFVETTLQQQSTKQL